MQGIYKVYIKYIPIWNKAFQSIKFIHKTGYLNNIETRNWEQFRPFHIQKGKHTCVCAVYIHTHTHKPKKSENYLHSPEGEFFVPILQT